MENRTDYINVLNQKIGLWDKEKILGAYERVQDAYNAAANKDEYQVSIGSEGWQSVPQYAIDTYARSIIYTLI